VLVSCAALALLMWQWRSCGTSSILSAAASPGRCLRSAG
jgi:protein-S-isoprenylcysteine O-methyltransferase Ste14